MESLILHRTWDFELDMGMWRILAHESLEEKLS